MAANLISNLYQKLFPPKKKQRLITTIKEDDDKVENIDYYFFLSDELIIEILLRVPTKSLFRFKSVCKIWKTLITDPSFLTAFITRSKSHPPLLTGFFYRPNNKPEAVLVNFHGVVGNGDNDVSFLRGGRRGAAVAAHKGYLLLAKKPELGSILHYHRVRYVVCNPLMKEWIDLPQSCYDHCIRHIVLFCYDKDGVKDGVGGVGFKVVSFICWRFNRLEVETFCSETRKWKLSTIAYHESFPLNHKVLFNGCVYFWKHRVLYVYDLNKEGISYMGLPRTSVHHSLIRFKNVGVLDGSLYYAEGNTVCFSVWVLGGVEWSLKHNVKCVSLVNEFPEVLKSGSVFRPFAFHPLNPNVVLVTLGHTEVLFCRAGTKKPADVFLYNMDTRRIELIDNFNPNSFSPVIPYFLPAWLPSLMNTKKHLSMRRRQK